MTELAGRARVPVLLWSELRSERATAAHPLSELCSGTGARAMLESAVGQIEGGTITGAAQPSNTALSTQKTPGTGSRWGCLEEEAPKRTEDTFQPVRQ